FIGASGTYHPRQGAVLPVHPLQCLRGGRSARDALARGAGEDAGGAGQFRLLEGQGTVRMVVESGRGGDETAQSRFLERFEGRRRTRTERQGTGRTGGGKKRAPSCLPHGFQATGTGPR